MSMLNKPYINRVTSYRPSRNSYKSLKRKTPLYVEKELVFKGREILGRFVKKCVVDYYFSENLGWMNSEVRDMIGGPDGIRLYNMFVFYLKNSKIVLDNAVDFDILVELVKKKDYNVFEPLCKEVGHVKMSMILFEESLKVPGLLNLSSDLGTSYWKFCKVDLIGFLENL